MSRRLEDKATVLAEGMAMAAIAGLLLLSIGTAVDVALRYLFASPIRGFVDIVGLAGAVLVSACMPHVVACRGNITIDFLGKALGGQAHRWLNRFGAFAVLVFFATMAWQLVAFAVDMYQTGQTMPVLRWPVWPWWAAVALCFSLTAGVSLATLGSDGDRS
ncbi:MAG: TRAP transporter small permease [Ideonella sp.]